MKCDHLRKGMDKYSILANEDMSTIVILDEDMPEFAVEINTKDMSMLVRIQVSENKEHNTVLFYIYSDGTVEKLFKIF